MSLPLVDKVRGIATEAIASTAGEQWGRLGFLFERGVLHDGGAENRAGEALIDPEALLALTFSAVATEPRLDQALAWWAVRGAGLLSLPRLDYVLGGVPADLTGALARFAARVWGAGNASGSWKERAKKEGLTSEPPPDRLKGTKAPRLTTPQALVLRTRSFSTLGAKADALAYLTAQGAEPSTVARMAKALGYTESAIRQAAADLAAAGLATTAQQPTSDAGRDPIRYQFRPGLIAPGDVPPWRFWPQIAAFLIGAARWGEDLRSPTPFLLASQARRLHVLLDAFRIEHALPAAYPVADPTRYPGEAYLGPFAETVKAVARWLADGLPSTDRSLGDAPGTYFTPQRAVDLLARLLPEASDQPILDPAAGTGAFLLGAGRPLNRQPRAPLAMNDAVSAYLARVEATLRTGDATEHSHRPALQTLLEAAGLAALGRPPSVVNEPRRTRVGAPDFVVRLAGSPIGYAEAKDVGVALDAETEQLLRYRAGLRNLLFTDGLTFRWFADGVERDAVALAEREGTGPSTHIREREGGNAALADLLGAFFRFEAPAVTTARELATRMAATTRMLREGIERTFTAEEERGALHQQLGAFRDVLLHDLTSERFADLYAQTLAYGLFAARLRYTGDPEDFQRLSVAAHLPRTNPFLQKLFYEIAGPFLDDRVAWLVDDLAFLLARADFGEILRAFGQRTRREDPVIHFYETFLQAYDPALRELRGVFYTPEPVVGYLVRSVDALLARDFPALPDGLADTSKVEVEVPDPDAPGAPPRTERVHRVQVLDPAVGTGTFLHAVVRAIHARFGDDEGLWDAYVADHLLPRVHGFELLMAPYAVAHLKLGLLLQETGYTFSRDERLGVYLTNALDDAGPAGGLPFAHWIAEEAEAADRVKRDVPVMVVLGNPPYSGHSANTGDWITRLMRGENTRYADAAERRTANYFEVDGKPLGEKNPKWLNDDYVKFVRMAQERIVRTGQGVLAFVTNHGFLDNPTFRGMRRSLMTAFDRLYVLDLHGNAKKQETTPEGGRDENVFDIMQGAAISVFVRLPDRDPATPAEVYHADLWGARTGKYAALDEADVTTTDWARLDPQAPAYLFHPVNPDLRDEYERGWSVTDLLPLHSVGIVTANDELTIHYTEDKAWETVQRFSSLPEEDARTEFDAGSDSTTWAVASAQRDLRASGLAREKTGPILFAPFDTRFTYYTGSSGGFLGRPRWETMRNMVGGNNIGLITTRQTRDEWSAFVADSPIRHKAGSRYDISTLFPLWRYPEPDTGLFATPPPAREANLAPAFVAALDEATGLRYAEHGPAAADVLTPEDAFHYVYGVFHAPAYRARYADFLRSDYARVPLPPTREAFRAFADLGRRLVALHLLRDVPDPGTRFPIRGSNVVDKGFPRYVAPGQPAPDTTTAKRGRVYLNATQYVEGVEPELWAQKVGGYPVLEKWLKDRQWLKDRRERPLSYDDLRRYPQIVAVLRETQRLMAEADEAAASAFGW